MTSKMLPLVRLGRAGDIESLIDHLMCLMCRLIDRDTSCPKML